MTLSTESHSLEATRIQLRGMTQSQVEELVRDRFGEKAYRGRQLFSWIHQRGARQLEVMTDLSKAFRARLSGHVSLTAITPGEAHDAPDGTTKMTFELHDGAVVESVVIPADGRVTLCVSSQVGCAMNCQFCLTARMGLVRNLSAAEIVDQVAWARELWEPAQQRRITNLVLMGMGEPLHNYDNVVQALRVLLDPLGMDFSKRRITVSTSGLVPAIERFGQEGLEVNLAVSLNGSNDAQRDAVMPVNKRWNLETLLGALRRFPLKPRQRITFEYVMLRGVNDSLEDALRVHKLLRGIPSKVNLIPWNPFPDAPYERPEPERVSAFRQFLVDKGLNTTVRETRGIEAMAACGQLGKPGQAERWREAVREARRRARDLDAVDEGGPVSPLAEPGGGGPG